MEYKVEQATCVKCYCNAFIPIKQLECGNSIYTPRSKCVECGTIHDAPPDNTKEVRIKIWFKKKVVR